jgi:hypothetical protein
MTEPDQSDVRRYGIDRRSMDEEGRFRLWQLIRDRKNELESDPEVQNYKIPSVIAIEFKMEIYTIRRILKQKLR